LYPLFTQRTRPQGRDMTIAPRAIRAHKAACHITEVESFTSVIGRSGEARKVAHMFGQIRGFSC
jgi:hypothetical protein